MPETIPREFLGESTCPACGYHVSVAFFEGGMQSLATLGWPKTAEQAVSMPRYPLAFVRCVDCGHIYNKCFDYRDVPYADEPNRMFNQGPIWSEHLQRVAGIVLELMGETPTVVEIGCGDAHFLRNLAKRCPRGRFYGFDPHGTFRELPENVEGRRELFDPHRHVRSLRPTVVISRHVLEHLVNPLSFLESLSFAADEQHQRIALYIEVPCVDRAFSHFRTEDFYYEHCSHFTSQSLKRLLQRCTRSIGPIEKGYEGEVLLATAHFGGRHSRRRLAQEALRFREDTRQAKARIHQQIRALVGAGKRLAVWGGTGKSAAFLNYFAISPDLVHLVVDSDPDKVGTFVPGTGQEILPPERLLEEPADIIIIPPQWRARDILLEIEARGLNYEQILIDYCGKLVDFLTTENPYRTASSHGVDA